MRAALALAVTMLAVATLACADVTITSTTSSKAPGTSVEGEVVTSIKGTRMRTDVTMRGRTRTTIIDLAARTLVSLNHEAKQAQRYDMGAYASELARVGDADVEVSLEPTGEARTLLGQACEGYRIRVSSVAFSSGRGGLEKTRMLMSGSAWIAGGSPGRADYAGFYGAVARAGLFFTDPRTVKAQPGQSKGLVALYRTVAEKGVPYSLDLRVTHERVPAQGDAVLQGQPLPEGPPSQPLVGASTTSTVTKISTDPIAASLFEVPEGYALIAVGR